MERNILRRCNRHRRQHGGAAGRARAGRLLPDRHSHRARRAERAARAAPRRSAGTSRARLAVARPGHDLPAVPRRARGAARRRCDAGQHGPRREVVSLRRLEVPLPQRAGFHLREPAADRVDDRRARAAPAEREDAARLGGRERDLRRAQHQRRAHASPRRSRNRAATERRSGDRRERPRLADSAAAARAGFRAAGSSLRCGSTSATRAACSARPTCRATGRRCTSSRSRRRSAAR